MTAIQTCIENHILLAWVVLAAAFVVLAKCADLFVDSSVTLAQRLRIPKLVIGIVLVSLATTTPELSVSMLAALRGNPEMALGNAVGSVICNNGVALALCAIFSISAIRVIPHVLLVSGGFLLAVSILAFVFIAGDYSLSRVEGAVLLALFAGYLFFLYRQHRAGRFQGDLDLERISAHDAGPSFPRMLGLFALALGGIILASNFVIVSATTIARSFGIPEAAIALTLVAVGTSIPEIATCVTAARKGQGDLAVGNILGANIMNICWVAGASAVANPLLVSRRETYFMFPAMFVLLLAALGMLRVGYSLTRTQGVILFGLYAAYILSFFFVFGG